MATRAVRVLHLIIMAVEEIEEALLGAARPCEVRQGDLREDGTERAGGEQPVHAL